MGAWGTGVYENDDALDWTYELEENGFSAIVGAFAQVATGEYLECPEVCGALAAADVVARMRNGDEPESGYAETASSWAAAHRNDDWSALVGPAIAVLDRIARPDDNENYELWTETDDLAEWLAVIADVKARLGSE